LEELSKLLVPLDYFRDETGKAGFPGLHIQGVLWGSPNKLNLLTWLNHLALTALLSITGVVRIRKIILNGGPSQLQGGICGMLNFRFLFFPMHRLDGMIHQDFLQKENKM
jgi:hypothetical protein